MKKNNSFSSPMANTLPDFTDFLKSKEEPAKVVIETVVEKTDPVKAVDPVVKNADQAKAVDPVIENADQAKAVDPVIENADQTKAVDPVVEKGSIADNKDVFEALKTKNSGKRSHFTTTLSEETQSNIKKMSLALEININDVVENCIKATYKLHEKEIQRLLRKKLL